MSEPQPFFSRDMRKNFFLSFGAALFLGVLLWIHSDPPPYGYPDNELSNHYWGIIIDIAHKWRSLNFSFWDRGVGGGTSLFASGFYPIFVPTNALAIFLSDDHFYLYKIIEPYVLGVFFTALTLFNVFRLRWPYALFGAFCYMGLGLGRFATLSDSPCFLWGCALFPAMIFAYGKSLSKGFYVQAAVSGALLALQFAGGGVAQFLQLTLWWLVFFFIQFWVSGRNFFSVSGIKRWLGGSFLFMFMAVGILGVQFLPTLSYVLFESARNPGQYHINNFPLIVPLTDKGSLWIYVKAFLIAPGGVSMRGIAALSIFTLALILSQYKLLRKRFSLASFPMRILLTSVVYFCLPTVASALAGIIPALAKMFKPFTMFTLTYGVHIIDFSLTLFICLWLADEELKVQKSSFAGGRGIIFVILMAVAFLNVLIPVLMCFPFFKNILLHTSDILKQFEPKNFKTAVLVLAATIVTCMNVAFRPRNVIFKMGCAFCLILLGFMNTLTSYHWNDKGYRSHAEEYHMNTAEYRYFQSAEGRYYLPYTNFHFISNNFNLLYGVHGTSGFLQIPAKRFNRFMAAYHNHLIEKNSFWWIPEYYIRMPFVPLTDYFPVDFTTIRRGHTLPWPGFIKEVSGERFDVWRREKPTPRVRLAQNLRIANFIEIIEKFDERFTDTIYMEKNDAAKFPFKEESFPLPGDIARVTDFRQSRGDEMHFQIISTQAAFVFVPEMFQVGWRAFVDGKNIDLFPADYLFIGFKVPAGTHQVVLRYRPPLLIAGAILNLLSIGILIYLIVRYNKKGRRPEMSAVSNLSKEV